MISLKKFLKSQGIKRKEFNEWETWFRQQVGEPKATKALEQSEQGKAIHDIHPFYDLFQSLDFFYDIRESFISDIEKILTQLPSRQLIVDAGCATGLDIILLALKYPNLQFKGYDNNGDHIEKANIRGEKVSNVQFYHSSHQARDNIPLADIVYTKMAISEISDNSKYLEFIKLMCKKVNHKGRYILAVHNDPNIPIISNSLEQDGIILEKTTRLQLPKTGWTAFNYYFQKSYANKK